MEKNKHLYIVSFGDSEKYRLSVSDSSATKASKETTLISLERELNDYLKKRFPESTFAYFTTPKVTEVNPEHEAQYAGYPVLDDKAVESIKRVLVNEIYEMEADKRLNLNAPYANVSAS